MSGHTPGTWRAVDGRILPDNYVLEGAPIATTHARKKAGMQDANARLIAAAPSLLLSNERLLGNFRLLLSGKPVRDVEETIAEAEQAIAAATGEQL